MVTEVKTLAETLSVELSGKWNLLKCKKINYFPVEIWLNRCRLILETISPISQILRYTVMFFLYVNVNPNYGRFFYHICKWCSVSNFSTDFLSRTIQSTTPLHIVRNKLKLKAYIYAYNSTMVYLGHAIFFVEKLCWAHEILSHAHNILFRAHDILSRAQDLLSRGHNILYRARTWERERWVQNAIQFHARRAATILSMYHSIP